MRTEEEQTQRQSEIVARYPGGLSGRQFIDLTLESADETDQVYPPWVDMWAGMSLLHRMMFDGLLRRRDYHKGGPWVLTEEGRKARAALTTGKGEP